MAQVFDVASAYSTKRNAIILCCPQMAAQAATIGPEVAIHKKQQLTSNNVNKLKIPPAVI